MNNNELCHYGVKGMKWGVRHYQNNDGSLTSAGKKRYNKGNNRSNTDKSQTDPQKKKKGLTDKQKKYIKIGAAAVGTALAVYGTYKIHQLYTGSNLKVDPETGFRLLDKTESDRKALNTINPGKIRHFSINKSKEIIDGSGTNCMLCTNAYEMRRRGYDVRAGLDLEGNGFLADELFGKMYKNYKGTDKVQPDLTKIYDYIKNQEDGARGNFMVWWDTSGGHSMIWENIHGRPYIKDAQTGTSYGRATMRVIMSSISKTKPVEFLRTDNAEIDMTEVKKWINTDTVLKTYVKHGKEIAKNLLSDNAKYAIVFGAYGLVATPVLTRLGKKNEVRSDATKKQSRKNK